MTWSSHSTFIPVFELGAFPSGLGRRLRMPERVVEKQPDRAAVWTFQEAEAVGGNEVISFNSRVNARPTRFNSGAQICTLRSQTYSFSDYITLQVVPS